MAVHDFVREIERPHRKLLTYYALVSLLFGPLFPVVFVPHYLRYRTLHYAFGSDGISMRWGALFRREVHLTYARIQDIHLRSNLVERWLGLGRLLIQTASGTSNAEVTIEGVLEFEALRDFIYTRMRGARGEADAGTDAPPEPGSAEELATLLERIAVELREIRGLFERGAGR